MTTVPEQLYDYGLSATFTKAVTDAAADPSLGDEDRFWALDTLAFWHFSNEDFTKGNEFLSQMSGLLPKLHSLRPQIAYYQKMITQAAHNQDATAVKQLYEAAKTLSNNDALAQRVIRYAYASALLRIDESREAEREAAALANLYYKIVGVTQQELFAKNLPDVDELLKSRQADFDDVKRLADTLYLYFLARRHRNVASTQEIITAHKLYAVTGFWSSAVRAGQEAADQILVITADPRRARMLLETLIAVVQANKLIDYLVPLRAHYAVILAYCGEHDRARRIMRELAPFVPDLPSEQRNDIVGQVTLIEDIARGARRLRPQVDPQDSLRLLAPDEKVGRNDPCPCGSGLKFKKCHG